MLTNGVVTLFCAKERGGDFQRTGVFPAWIQRKERLKNTSDGVYLCDNFDVRIAYSLIKHVNVGDLIYFGDLANDEFAAEKCRKVAAVSENAFGSNPHWHLEAEFQYR